MTRFRHGAFIVGRFKGEGLLYIPIRSSPLYDDARPSESFQAEGIVEARVLGSWGYEPEKDYR
jgi:hypothetical protein